jgi:hypothetical protein
VMTATLFMATFGAGAVWRRSACPCSRAPCMR